MTPEEELAPAVGVEEQVLCPNCHEGVLFPPPNTRAVTIVVEQGEEPVVYAEDFAGYELVAVLARATENTRHEEFLADGEDTDTDEDEEDA